MAMKHPRKQAYNAYMRDYMRKYYRKHPEKRKQYQIQNAIALLTANGYSVQLDPEAVNQNGGDLDG